MYSKAENAQDAHEAIRPTYLEWNPDRLKDSLKEINYACTFDHERFLASQMSPAVYDVITIHISAGYYIFRANGSRKAFTGYTAVYMESNDEGSDEKDVNLPLLKEGQELQLKEWKPNSILLSCRAIPKLPWCVL